MAILSRFRESRVQTSVRVPAGFIQVCVFPLVPLDRCHKIVLNYAILILSCFLLSLLFISNYKTGRYVTYTELFTVIEKVKNREKYNYSPIFNLSELFNKFSMVINSNLVN